MKVALFSDIITWIGTGTVIDDPCGGSPPDFVTYAKKTYKNLAFFGGATLDNDIAAGYVLINGVAGYPVPEVIDVTIFDKPVSTEGA